MHFWKMLKIKQCETFFLNFERTCKLIKEEKLANKSWGSPNLFKSYLENKQKNKPKHWSNRTDYQAHARDAIMFKDFDSHEGACALN